MLRRNRTRTIFSTLMVAFLYNLAAAVDVARAQNSGSDDLSTSEIQGLVEALSADDASERSTAARKLGAAGARATPYLIKALEDKDDRTRAAATDALKQQSGAPLGAAIARLLITTKSPSTRGAAAEILYSLAQRDPESVPTTYLLSMARRRNAAIQPAAIEAVGLVRADAGKKTIEALVDDKDDALRRAATLASAMFSDDPGGALIKLLTAKKPAPAVDERVPAALRGLVASTARGDDDDVLQAGAAFYLKFFAKKDHLPALEEACHAHFANPKMRLKIARAILEVDSENYLGLLSIIQHGNEIERIEIIETISRMSPRNTSATSVLVEALTDWDTGPNAAAALVKRGWSARSINDRAHFFVARREGAKLEQGWNSLGSVLMRDLESSESRVVRNAVFAIVKVGDERDVNTMIRTLNKKDNLIIAQAFLNCGHAGLQNAAREWAKRHGYTVLPKFGVGGAVQWNSW